MTHNPSSDVSAFAPLVPCCGKETGSQEWATLAISVPGTFQAALLVP